MILSARYSSALLLAWITILCLSTSAPALEIRCRETGEVQHERITLSEICDLPQKTGEARWLAALELLPSPPPGAESLIRMAEIQDIVERKQTGTETITWSGPDLIRIKRSAIHIGPVQVKAILDEFLASQKDILPAADLHFKTIHPIKPFDLPIGGLDTEVIASDPSILNSRRFTIIFRVDSRVEKNIAVHAELEAVAPIVVAASDLRRGTILKADDLNVVERDIIGIHNPSFNSHDLIGKTIKRSLRLGYPIDQADTEWPPIIHRGELVTIFVHKGPLLITARGTARQDARKGEIVKVLNNSSEKEILCRVNAPGFVQVEM
jgi:flagella basal body P-ring formation protein FlgA